MKTENLVLMQMAKQSLKENGVYTLENIFMYSYK
jgi:hypothetical protein